jgi:hypothetical protein
MEALIRIQKDLKVPKERYNKFGDFYFRNAEDILKAVKPLQREGEMVSTTTEIKMLGPDVYFGVTATFSKGAESEARISWAREEHARPKMGPGQLSGAAESYAKKYALGNLFALDDGIDADHPMPPTTGTPAPTGPTPWDGAQGQQPPPAPPAETPPPATAPQGQIPAPTSDQRQWLKLLWDYYVAQSGGRLKAVDAKPMHKMLTLCHMHFNRFPGSMSDVEQLKKWINVEQLCV